jgi:hypothetical protein
MERYFEKKFHIEQPKRFVIEYELGQTEGLKGSVSKKDLSDQYLKVNLKNLDNGKETSLLLEPTKGFTRYSRIWKMRFRYRYSKTLYVISNKEVSEICDGSNFRLSVRYNGDRTYSFKFRVKE